MHPQFKGDESTRDTIGLRGLGGRMSRGFAAVLADLKSADSGSVDVLMYCEEDLAMSTSGEMEVDQPR